jgi:hypothetical protein
LVVGKLPTTTYPPGTTLSAGRQTNPTGAAATQAPRGDVREQRALTAGRDLINRRAGAWLLALSLKLLTSNAPECSLPTLLGTITMPYGLTSPLAGTVEVNVETFVSCDRNGVAVVVVVLEVAGADAAVELVLLELPQPASAGAAAAARATNESLGTGLVPV